jgi:hypothetical protein
MFDHLTVAQWAVLVLAAFLLGIAKSGIPGLGILAIPLVAWVIPARASTGLILPMLIIGDLFAVSYYRRHAQWRHLWALIPWALVGVVLGTLALGWVSDRQLKPIMGAIIIGMLLLHLWRQRPGSSQEIPHRRSFAAGMGLLGGITTMMANAAGPIMTIYLLAMRLPKQAFLGTGAWYFLLVNWLKVPFSVHLGLINVQSLKVNLLLAPAIIAGAVLGILVVRRIPEKRFDQVVLVLTALAAIRLLIPG